MWERNACQSFDRWNKKERQAVRSIRRATDKFQCLPFLRVYETYPKSEESTAWIRQNTASNTFQAHRIHQNAHSVLASVYADLVMRLINTRAHDDRTEKRTRFNFVRAVAVAPTVPRSAPMRLRLRTRAVLRLNPHSFNIGRVSSSCPRPTNRGKLTAYQRPRSNCRHLQSYGNIKSMISSVESTTLSYIFEDSYLPNLISFRWIIIVSDPVY